MATTLADVKKRVMGHVGRQGVMVTDTETLEAINGAISEVRNEMPYDVASDVSIVLANDTYEYDISTLSFSLVWRITMADSEGDYPAENVIPAHHYFFRPVGKLVFDEAYFVPIDSRHLKIEGQKMQADLASDSDVFYISVAFVALQAAASLLDSVNMPQRAANLYRRAEEARQNSPFRCHPNTKIVWGV